MTKMREGNRNEGRERGYQVETRERQREEDMEIWRQKDKKRDEKERNIGGGKHPLMTTVK